MADAGVYREEGRPARHPVRTAAKWAGIVLGGLLLIIAGLYFGINTDVGRRYVVRQINSLETASGLDIDVGSIEGSIYGELTIRDLTLKDPKGTFFYAPVAVMDWRPFSYFRNHIDIKAITIPRARLSRLPELKESGDPNAPMLPDLDIDIGRFEVGRMMIDPPVTGQRHLVSLGGRIKIDDGRAQVALNAGALVGPGIAGGDKLVLRLDAVPDANRFDIGARVEAPANGFVSGMTGIRQPLVAAIGGRGSWTNWQGRAQAVLGGRGLANLAISGRDGTFTVTGPLRPSLVVTGPLQKLVSPLVQVNLVTSLADRRADTRLRLNSAALALSAEGLLDLGQSRFGNMRVNARLLQPGAIAPNLRGRDVRVGLVLNGGFATPEVAYDLQAAALGFEETVLEGFRATGRATLGVEKSTIPISARIRRITGLNEAVGGLLTNVAVDGTLAVSGTRILSDNLRIRSDKLNATAIIAADMARGQYTAGLQGRINNYLVRGVGLLDITSNMDVVSQGEGFGIRGRVAVRTRRIDNAGVRDFLGGNANISANIAMTPTGAITFDRLRVAAPLLRVTSGSGSYSPDGHLDRLRPVLAHRDGHRHPAAGPAPGGKPRLRNRPLERLGAGAEHRSRLRDQRHRPVAIRALLGRRARPHRAWADDVRDPPPPLRRHHLRRAGRPDSRRAVRRDTDDEWCRPRRHRSPRCRRKRAARRCLRAGKRGADTRRHSDPHPAGNHRGDRHPLSEPPGYRRRRPACRRPPWRSPAPDRPRPGQLPGRQRPSAGGGARDERSALQGRLQHRSDARPHPRRRPGHRQPDRLPPRQPGGHPQGGGRLAACADDHRPSAGQCPPRRPLRQRHGDPVAARRARPFDLQRLLARPRPRRPSHRQPRLRSTGRRRLPAGRPSGEHR
jgi:hypothetical protein